MKILFIGTVFFSKSILDVILRSKNQIVGAIGKKNNNFNSDYFDIVKYSKARNIQSIYSKNINSKQTAKWIRKKNPDLIFCIGWNNLLKKHILKIAPKGVIGYHPSDLPLNRGRHPIIWSIALGLKKIGSTFYFMDKKADNGKIISKKILKIKKNINSDLLYNDLTRTSKKQVKKILISFSKGNIKSLKQKSIKPNFWRKRNFDDGKIDWRMSAFNIQNLINALNKPYPGAHFIFKNKKYIVWKSQIIKNKLKNIEPGKIIKILNKNPIVKCGEDSIKLLNIKPKLNLEKIKYL